MERKKLNERAVKFKRDPHVFVKSIKALSPDTVEERSSCEEADSKGPKFEFELRNKD